MALLIWHPSEIPKTPWEILEGHGVHAQIVCTIHQPSSDICERFDDLILLSCGRMLYCGQWAAADQYFAAAGFECAPFQHSKPSAGRFRVGCLTPNLAFSVKQLDASSG